MAKPGQPQPAAVFKLDHLASVVLSLTKICHAEDNEAVKLLQYKASGN